MAKTTAVHFILDRVAPCGKTALGLALSTRFSSLPSSVRGCRACLLAAAKFKEA
jgi:hypothetical protein